eukprot:6202015-Pleurochrysis_carterae.AAC.2
MGRQEKHGAAREAWGGTGGRQGARQARRQANRSAGSTTLIPSKHFLLPAVTKQRRLPPEPFHPCCCGSLERATCVERKLLKNSLLRSVSFWPSGNFSATKSAASPCARQRSRRLDSLRSNVASLALTSLRTLSEQALRGRVHDVLGSTQDT